MKRTKIRKKKETSKVKREKATTKNREQKQILLDHVGALDCIKPHSWRATFGLINQKEQKKCRKKKTTKSVVASSKKIVDDMLDTKSKKQNKIKPTKLERKAFYDDCRRTLNKTWQFVSDGSSDTDEVDVVGINLFWSSHMDTFWSMALWP